MSKRTAVAVEVLLVSTLAVAMGACRSTEAQSGLQTAEAAATLTPQSVVGDYQLLAMERSGQGGESSDCQYAAHVELGGDGSWLRLGGVPSLSASGAVTFLKLGGGMVSTTVEAFTCYDRRTKTASGAGQLSLRAESRTGTCLGTTLGAATSSWQTDAVATFDGASLVARVQAKGSPENVLVCRYSKL